MADDRKFYDVATYVLDCARAALDETTYGAPARAYVAVGEPAHDDCCEGQLTVSMVRQFASAVFPDPDLRPIVCNAALTAVELNVEIVRCAPTQDDLGRPPSVEALSASALQAAVEARAVWLGVQCCLRARAVDDWSAIVGDQAGITPAGGCVGSRLSVTVGLIDGCACA